MASAVWTVPDVPSPKYEQEIRSILNKLDDFLPDDQVKPTPIRRRTVWRGSGRRVASALRWLFDNPFLAGVLCILVGWFVAQPLLGRPVGLALGVAGGCCFLLYFLKTVRNLVVGGPALEKRWRGHAIEDPIPPMYRSVTRWWRKAWGSR